MRDGVGRRTWLGLAGMVLGGLGPRFRAARAQAVDQPPVLFLHGNGDSAALWMPTIWRFESNGYPRARLFALDMRFPVARDVDAVRQAARSSVEDAIRQLVQEVNRIRRVTRADRLVLVGHGRGGNVIRAHLREGGAAGTQLAILCAAPGHGLIVSDSHMVGSEFNGASDFLLRLNGFPEEAVPGVRCVTVRSDRNDKDAQPDGRFLGLPGVATGVGFDGPALKGAQDIVLPGADHRETGFAPRGFATLCDRC